MSIPSNLIKSISSLPIISSLISLATTATTATATATATRTSTLLPLLTSIIGIGALTVSLFGTILPHLECQIYGLKLHQATTTTSNPQNNSASLLLRNLKIRNLTAGTTILILTKHWQDLEAQNLPDAATAARRCLGLVICIGTFVPLVDGYVALTTTVSPVFDATSAKVHHVESPEKDEPDTYFPLANVAYMIHFSRFFAWLVGGIWCLYA